MGFQILNSNNEPISIKELDIEAAAFWNKIVDPKWYANPSPEGTAVMKQWSNWFDTIGYCIHSQGNACSGWSNIVATMMAESLGMLFIDTSEGYKERPIPIIEWQRHDFYNMENEKKISYHLPDKLEENIFGSLEYYKPYIQLINHWKAKGYTPNKID